MGTQVVAKITRGTNGTRFEHNSPILIAAMSRQGWGSRAEFLARYRYQPLPNSLPGWAGEAVLVDEPKIGASVRLETPFGVLEPIYPLTSRVLFMPKINRP